MAMLGGEDIEPSSNRYGVAIAKMLPRACGLASVPRVLVDIVNFERAAATASCIDLSPNGGSTATLPFGREGVGDKG